MALCIVPTRKLSKIKKRRDERDKLKKRKKKNKEERSAVRVSVLKELIFYLALIEDQAGRKKFEQLYEKYHNLMYHRAYEILNDEQIAEDAVSEALIKLAINIEKVGEAESTSAKAFTMQILEHTAIDLYRKRRKEMERYRDLEEIKERLTVPEPESWSGSALAKAILELPFENRQVILLKYAQGYDNAEIAALLDFTVAKVEKLLSRGKRKLQQNLSKCAE